MAVPVPDLNSIENEWAELNRRSANMGVCRIWILYGRMLSDLLSCVLQTHQALEERSQSCYLGKRRLQKVFNKRANNCSRCVLDLFNIFFTSIKGLIFFK